MKQNHVKTPHMEQKQNAPNSYRFPTLSMEGSFEECITSFSYKPPICTYDFVKFFLSQAYVHILQFQKSTLSSFFIELSSSANPNPTSKYISFFFFFTFSLSQKLRVTGKGKRQKLQLEDDEYLCKFYHPN